MDWCTYALPKYFIFEVKLENLELSLGCFCSHYYRPQTKFAKVMFLQVFVCPWAGGCMAKMVCVAKGGMHGKGWGHVCRRDGH